MSQMSKMSVLAVAAIGLGVLNSFAFVAPCVPKSLTFPQSETAPMLSISETNVPACGMALLATAAVGFVAVGAQRTLRVARKDGATHGIKFSYSIQKDAYADLEFMNDVGYLPDGTPMNRAGNAINHPESIGPDPHTPGSPLPRAIFTNSVGYLPDGTAMNAAGNALNHPETMQPDMHVPGSPLPRSHYAADIGYLVDGTDMLSAGNLSVQGVAAPAAPAAAVAAAFVGAPVDMGTAQTTADKRVPSGLAYAVQKDAYVDLTFGNDVGYLPDGTPMNRAGNAVNHPETIGPDPHSDGSELPPSVYAADIGYLVDGTPLDAAGNNAVH